MRTLIFLLGCVIGAIIATTALSCVMICREDKKKHDDK